MNMFTLDSELIKEGVTFELVKPFINQHQKELSRFKMLEDYYKGEQDILSRTKDSQLSNNRLVCNHAKYITDIATGYLVGEPVDYSGDKIDDLKTWYKRADTATQDMDLAKDCSVYGRSFELVYFSDDESPVTKLATLNPSNTFVVYDDTVEHKELIAVYYYPVYGTDWKIAGYKCSVYTAEQEQRYLLGEDFSLQDTLDEYPNNFDYVPVTEIYNNEECQGDFEQVISLIDAYNVLQSDRVNDKEQFLDAILILVNAKLGDTDGETTEALRQLKKRKALEVSENGDVRWLTRTFDETSVEVLRKALEQDIHKFANVPCLTDENFVGNSSGVAMRYKMLGFEQLTKIKERYFVEGLRRRLLLFNAAMNKKGKETFDPIDVNITFTRSLPSNEVEIASMITQLDGMVSTETLISQLPFVDDPEIEIQKLADEKGKGIQAQQESFGYTENAEPVTEDGE